MKPTSTVTARVKKTTVIAANALAKKYAVKVPDVLDVAVNGLEAHLAQTSSIQIPELVAAVSDLNEVATLLTAQTEELERLGLEMMIQESAPPLEQA